MIQHFAPLGDQVCREGCYHFVSSIEALKTIAFLGIPHLSTSLYDQVRDRHLFSLFSIGEEVEEGRVSQNDLPPHRISLR
jgi:hypothetical protein